MAKQKVISYKTEDQTQGGLLDDVDVEVVEAQWVTWDYNGKAQVESPALKLSLSSEGLDTPVEQYWSAGDIRSRVPSDDGEQLVAAEGSNATGLPRGCNAALFFASLESAGFDMDVLADGVSQLVGLGFHLLRIKAPNRSGLAIANDEKRQPAMIATVQAINYLPGEKKGKKSASKPAAGKKAAKPADDDDRDASDFDDEVREAITEAVGDKGLPITRLAVKLYTRFKDRPDRKLINDRVQDEEYLKGLGFEVENGVVSA